LRELYSDMRQLGSDCRRLFEMLPVQFVRVLVCLDRTPHFNNAKAEVQAERTRNTMIAAYNSARAAVMKRVDDKTHSAATRELARTLVALLPHDVWQLAAVAFVEGIKGMCRRCLFMRTDVCVCAGVVESVPLFKMPAGWARTENPLVYDDRTRVLSGTIATVRRVRMTVHLCD